MAQRVECKRLRLMRDRSEGYLLTVSLPKWPPGCEYLATVEVNANEDSDGMLTSTKVVRILDRENTITDREIIEYFEFDDAESESLYSSLIDDDDDEDDEDDPADDWKRQ